MPFFIESADFFLLLLFCCCPTGDEMGLGKTLQALAVACAYREDWPVLVVAPSSLKANWKKESKKWVPGLTEDTVQVEMPREGRRPTRLAAWSGRSGARVYGGGDDGAMWSPVFCCYFLCCCRCFCW